MGMTFQNTQGQIFQLDNYNEVDVDKDIVTGTISGYYISDGVYREKVTKETYEAAKKYYSE